MVAAVAQRTAIAARPRAREQTAQVGGEAHPVVEGPAARRNEPGEITSVPARSGQQYGGDGYQNAYRYQRE